MSQGAQKKFTDALHMTQSMAATPEKMPYLCVIGFLDYDELVEECKQLYAFQDYRLRVDSRLAEWDPTNAFITGEDFTAFRHRVEQEEFDREEHVTTKPPQSPDEAEALTTLDPRQQVSLTDNFEFCGCKCFRALGHARGFWFA